MGKTFKLILTFIIVLFFTMFFVAISNSSDYCVNTVDFLNNNKGFTVTAQYTDVGQPLQFKKLYELITSTRGDYTFPIDMYIFIEGIDIHKHQAYYLLEEGYGCHYRAINLSNEMRKNIEDLKL